MKQLALILVLALLICACGCQPASLSSGGASTEPFASDPSETAPLQTEELAPFEYECIVEANAYCGTMNPALGKPEVAVVNSEEDELWVLYGNKVESYNENFFEDHSLIFISFATESLDIKQRMCSISETKNGEYLVSIETCSPDMELTKYGGGSRVLIVVNRVLTDDAVIRVEEIPVTLPVEEFDAYFGTNGGHDIGADC